MDIVDDLEKLRHEDPAAALAGASAIARATDLGVRDSALLLGVAASCYRQLNQRPEAELLLDWQLYIGREIEDRLVCGDALQRLSALTADGGKFEQALRLAEEALGEHLLTGDLDRVGQAMYDRAQVLDMLGDCRAALAVVLAARGYLAPQNRRSRDACLILLGIIHHRLGNLDQAEDFARRALKRPTLSKTARASLFCLIRDIRAQEGRFEDALENNRQARELYPPKSLDNAITWVYEMELLARLERRKDLQRIGFTVQLFEIERSLAEKLRAAAARPGTKPAFFKHHRERLEANR